VGRAILAARHHADADADADADACTGQRPVTLASAKPGLLADDSRFCRQPRSLR